MEEIIKKIGLILNEIKEKKPLIHCITNSVTINDCANAILAIGASPIMAEDIREIDEILEIANSLVINIGTIDKNQEETIKKACESANNKNIPIIFDPVGVGISSLRNKISLHIINNYKIALIKGNMSEIKAIANLIFENTNVKGNGVDANSTDITNLKTLNSNINLVKKLAKKLNTVIIASGPIDIISNGEKTIIIKNGDEMMMNITGSGCMLAAICGSCIGVSDALEGSVLACLLMSISGENAREYINKSNLSTGTFRAVLIDYLSKITSEDIVEKSNIDYYES